jgi:hypothetical protein
MNNQHDDAGKVKDGIGKRKVARYAHALGMKTLSNLSELEGKFVKVSYGPNKRGYNEVSEIAAFNSTADMSVDTIAKTMLTPPPAKEESEALPF